METVKGEIVIRVLQKTREKEAQNMCAKKKRERGPRKRARKGGILVGGCVRDDRKGQGLGEKFYLWFFCWGGWGRGSGDYKLRLLLCNSKNSSNSALESRRGRGKRGLEKEGGGKKGAYRRTGLKKKSRVKGRDSEGKSG